MNKGLSDQIIKTTERTLENSKSGYINLIGIEGISEQSESPALYNPQEIKSVADGGNLTIIMSNNDGTSTKEIIIPLSEPLREWDEITVVDGVWGVNRRTINVVNADMVLAKHGFTNDSYLVAYVSNTGFYASRDMLSTHFPVIENASDLVKTAGVYMHHSTTTNPVHLSVPVSTASTVDELKTWLLDNNVAIYYPLATPVFEAFEDQTLFYSLESYDGVTYVSTDSEVEPNITLEYGTDTVGALALQNYNLARYINNSLTVKEFNGTINSYFADTTVSWAKVVRSGNVVTVSYYINMAVERTMAATVITGLPLQANSGSGNFIVGFAVRDNDEEMFKATLDAGSITIGASASKPLTIGNVLRGSFTYVAN